jgi:hypothetical protein
LRHHTANAGLSVKKIDKKPAVSEVKRSLHTADSAANDENRTYFVHLSIRSSGSQSFT